MYVIKQWFPTYGLRPKRWVALKFFWVACFSNFSACFSFSFAKSVQKIKINFYSSLLIYTANQTDHKKVYDVNKS